MGFFDFFSEPPLLDEKFKSVLDTKSRNDKNIINRLAKAQQSLLKNISPDEKFLFIFPNQTYHNSFGAITIKHIIEFDNNTVRQIPIKDITILDSNITEPNGNRLFILSIISKNVKDNISFYLMGIIRLK